MIDGLTEGNAIYKQFWGKNGPLQVKRNKRKKLKITISRIIIIVPA